MRSKFESRRREAWVRNPLFRSVPSPFTIFEMPFNRENSLLVSHSQKSFLSLSPNQEDLNLSLSLHTRLEINL